MRASKRKTSNKNILANRYIILSEIDSGLTSHVYKVLDKKTGKTRVAKIYENNYEKLFNKEVQIFQLFEQQDNPNIIRCYEFGFDQTKRKPYIIQEYGSKGCLMDSILKLKCAFTEDVCKYILLNLINAVDALHQKGFCHRDIKPENIVLVGDNYDIKLIDFGFATKYINEENQKIKLEESFGTQYYRAPEIIEKKPYDGTKVDIFSIGATLFTIMRGLTSLNQKEIIECIDLIIKSTNGLNYLHEYFDINNINCYVNLSFAYAYSFFCILVDKCLEEYPELLLNMK